MHILHCCVVLKYTQSLSCSYVFALNYSVMLTVDMIDR